MTHTSSVNPLSTRTESQKVPRSRTGEGYLPRRDHFLRDVKPLLNLLVLFKSTKKRLTVTPWVVRRVLSMGRIYVSTLPWVPTTSMPLTPSPPLSESEHTTPGSAPLVRCMESSNTGRVSEHFSRVSVGEDYSVSLPSVERVSVCRRPDVIMVDLP